jgi:hypothetical protein
VQQYRVAPLAGVPVLQFKDESASSGVSEPVHENPYELPWHPCTDESGAHELCSSVTQQKSVFDSSAVPGPQSRRGFPSVGRASPAQEYPFAAFAQLMVESELQPSGPGEVLLTVHAATAAARQSAAAIVFTPGKRRVPVVAFMVISPCEEVIAPRVPSALAVHP